MDTYKQVTPACILGSAALHISCAARRLARSNTFCRSHKVGDYSHSGENRWPPSYERLDPAKADCWWEWVREGARPPQAATICSLSYTRLTPPPPPPESASPMALFPLRETVPPAGNAQCTFVASCSRSAYVFVLYVSLFHSRNAWEGFKLSVRTLKWCTT